ncbi:Bcr/CflA family drug resistance efflux transporter [Paraburkholderia strydomiana]|nr:Bcr/CflA family drug resistance efflux transporter [Paraburkholderia strydomiana]
MSSECVDSIPRIAPPFWVLVLIALGGTMAMHMFVPALPDAAQSLHAQAGQMQMAISIYIIGLAVGQLIYGPLSDSFGRRPLLMIGLIVYVVGGLIIALAPNLSCLLFGRLVQALGSCAGVALGRAIVRDTSDGGSSVSQLALLNLMVVMSPGFAPMIGGFVAGAWGWRIMFALLSLTGAFTLGVAWKLLPETRRAAHRTDAANLVADYRALLGSARFLGFAVGNGLATFSIYAFLSAAPFILVNELHLPLHLVGIYMGLMIAGMAIGNLITVKLAKRVCPVSLMRVGCTISFVCAFTLLCILLLGRLDVRTVVCGIVLFTCGSGMVNPVALANALSVNDRLIGSAAGLCGCIQYAVGAVCTTVAALGPSPAFSALLVLVIATATAQFAFFLALAKRPAR